MSASLSRYVVWLGSNSSGDPKQKLPCCLSRLAAVPKVLGRGPWQLRSFSFLLEMIAFEHKKIVHVKHLASSMSYELSSLPCIEKAAEYVEQQKYHKCRIKVETLITHNAT